MIKKIEKELQRLELKDLNNLKNQYEKLEQSTDDFFEKQEGKSK